MNKQISKVTTNPLWVMNVPNYLLNGDGFYISYNPDTANSHTLTDLANMFGGDVKDGEETALVHKENGKRVYRILTGDFRDEYEKLYTKGFKACYDFFKSKQKEYGNNWSTLDEDRKENE